MVYKLSPVTATEARKVPASIRAARVLRGSRRETGVKAEGVQEIIQRISQLVTDLPLIRKLDLNPVIAFEDSILVADERIAL